MDSTETRTGEPRLGWAEIAVFLTMRLGRILFDMRTAAVAGLILTTSFGFVFFARTAAADAENVAGILTAIWLVVRRDGRPRWYDVLAFWAVVALTCQMKGL